MNQAHDLGMLLGRILLVLIFVMSGLSKITGFATTAGYMAKMGVPLVYPALLLSILMELGGGLLILIGYHTRLVAILVLLWFIPVTLIFHLNTWRHGQDAMINMIMFLKNVSIMGGLLLVASAGPGAYSVDGTARAD